MSLYGTRWLRVHPDGASLVSVTQGPEGLKHVREDAVFPAIGIAAVTSR